MAPLITEEDMQDAREWSEGQADLLELIRLEEEWNTAPSDEHAAGGAG